MLWINIGILVVQIVIALTSYFTIHRHRAIYGLKTAVLRMPTGSKEDIEVLKTDHIEKILIDGKHTILQIVERADKDLEIIIGKIKN